MKTILFISVFILFLVTISFAGMLPPATTAITLYCWDSNGSGTCDGGEDVNNDGSCTVADCQGSPGEDGAPGPQGATGFLQSAGTPCDEGYASIGVDTSGNARGCFKPVDKSANWEAW